MSSILWVEDFEGERFRELSFAVFGDVYGLDSAIFPNQGPELRRWFQSRNVTVAMTFDEALEAVRNRVQDFDAVILDIDLNLSEEVPEQATLSILQRWYAYDREADDDVSYNAAVAKMKAEAGYHLFVELVTNLRFPRTNILFCSDHGENLASKQECFRNAKIDAPDIFRKGDKRVSDWISDVLNHEYTRVRRAIVNACSLMSEELRSGTYSYFG